METGGGIILESANQNSLDEQIDAENNVNVVPSTFNEPPPIELEEPPGNAVDTNTSFRKLIYKTSYCNVFKNNKTGLLSFNWASNAPSEAKEILSYAIQLQNIVKAEINKPFKVKCINVIADAVSSSLMICMDADREISGYFDYAYNFIQKTKEKQAKDILLHSHPEYEIYLSKETETLNFWATKELREKKNKEIDEYGRLKSIINIFLKGNQKELAYRQLGTTLSSSLTNNDNRSPNKKFKEIETYIYSRASSSAKIYHFTATLILILLSISCAVYFYINIDSLEMKEFIAGSIAGVVGSFISITQRNDKIIVDFTAPASLFLIQSFSRLILGVFFGFITILLIRSNLTSLLDDFNIYSMSILCLVAGFSERFVPDLLDKISNKPSSEDSAS